MTSAISSSVRPLVRAILKWMASSSVDLQRDQHAQRNEAAVAATEAVASPQPTEDIVNGDLEQLVAEPATAEVDVSVGQ